MTIAVCTNCGELKFGGLTTCPNCDSDGLDFQLGVLLSDHNLSERELGQIGHAITAIHRTQLSEDLRFHLLAYFLSRKWPKLLEYDIDAVDDTLSHELDRIYQETLFQMPGQETPDLKVSPIQRQTWTTATSSAMQRDDEAWQAEAREMLIKGMGIARNAVAVVVESGEGAVLQRLRHLATGLFASHDYQRVYAISEQLAGDSRSYSRTVEEFCARVKNGWSDRTKEQAACFRGLCDRLEEMASHAKAIVAHKSGRSTLIGMDFKRVKEQFDHSYKLYIDLSYVVLDPTRIGIPGGD